VLLDKKEKLWKGKDIYMWECEDMLKLEANRVLATSEKDMAFGYMLTRESEALAKMKEELCFIQNQCWDEVRRVNSDNSVILREKLFDMGQQMCEYINGDHIQWADFLSNFADQED
jgi:hypothetical protein